MEPVYTELMFWSVNEDIILCKNHYFRLDLVNYLTECTVMYTDTEDGNNTCITNMDFQDHTMPICSLYTGTHKDLTCQDNHQDQCTSFHAPPDQWDSYNLVHTPEGRLDLDSDSFHHILCRWRMSALQSRMLHNLGMKVQQSNERIVMYICCCWKWNNHAHNYDIAS